jgi:hypothetical protein
MKETLEDISELEFKIIKNINKLTALLTPEVLEYAKNEKKFWRGEIGHIRRKVQLYAQNIPSFEILESNVEVEDEKEFIPKILETAKAELSSIEKTFLPSEPFSLPNVSEDSWRKATAQLQEEFKQNKFRYDVFIDDQVVNSVKGFMYGPVGVFRGKPIEATIIQKYDNIYELIIFLNLQAKTKDIVLYMTFKEDDKYCFRGNFVDKL